VVLWSENHPTNLEAWRLRAQWDSAGAPLFDVVPVTFNSSLSNSDIATAFIREIGNRTRFVSFSATANSTGFRMPEPVIQEIWDYVRNNRPNCHVHIDGTMEWGARAIDLSNPRCHSFVSSAHKWFLGPKETGILYMSPDKAENFSPSIFAYDYKIEIGPWPNMPKNALRFELLGQRDDVNIITLAETQLFWDALAPNDPYKRVSDLAQYLKDLLRRSPAGRWNLVTPESSERSLGVVRVEAPRQGREKSLYHWLYDTRRIAGSGDDATFRLCPHIYNTMQDVENAVAGMNAWRALRS
jgi:selenocysteine lyase/cysteine desulfurase